MSNTGEDYIHSLKQIKELEEKVQVEIDSRKRQVEDEMTKLDLQLKSGIAQAKSDGQKLVEQNVELAKKNAHEEADRIISDAHTRSKNLRLNQKAAKQVIEILLSGL